MLRRIDLQDRSDGCVNLGIQQNHVLAVLERFESHARAELDRTSHIHQHIHFRGPGQQKASSVTTVLPSRMARSTSSCRMRSDHVFHAAVFAQIERPLRLAVENRHHAHTSHGVDDVIAQARDMKPAPIRATRIGRPSASRAFNALSTIIMATIP